jgi:ABC-type nitrate/sulfonate/bicarbonate transport system substrate-binding protein
MRNLSVVCLILVFGVMLSACTALRAPVDSPTPAPGAAAELGAIRFAEPGSPNVKDIPTLVALDSLRAQGYAVELTEFARYDLMAAALEQGDVDFATLTASRAWAAVAKGAGICTVVGEYNSTFDLVVHASIQACDDLDDKVLAFPSGESAGYILFEQYLKDNCPEAKPEILFISGSENRVAGLLADEMEGTYLELSDWLKVDSQVPGRYHVLDYLSAYPEVQTGGICVRCAWAEQYPDVVRDFITALVTAQRDLTANPEQLQAEMVRRLDLDATEAQTTAEAYLVRGIWDLNGGITPENIQYTLDTLANAGALPSDLEVEDVVDLSYMNAVLDEIGRR